MTDELDGMFKKVSFDEAYRTSMEQDKKCREYVSQGAVLDGPSDLDREYTTFSNQSSEYHQQFSGEELALLMTRALAEGKL